MKRAVGIVVHSPIKGGKLLDCRVGGVSHILSAHAGVEDVWSTVLDYEVNRSPYQDRIDLILQWRLGATENVFLDRDLIARGV